MGATTSNSPLFNFITRWLFSTNHKCGASISSTPKIRVFYKKVVIVKPLNIYPKFSKEIKRFSVVFIFVSLGKRISKMISPFGGAVVIGKPWNVKWSYLSKLLCELKGLPIRLVCCYIPRFCAALSQDLEKSYKNHGLLRYGYKTGLAFLGERLGKSGKPFGLCSLSRNGALPVNTKRNFSAGGVHNFKKLNKYKGKYNNLIEVIADIDFLQSAYQQIKSNPGVMAKGSDSETLDGLNEEWFIKTSERLLHGSYQFKPAKRIMIPKANKVDLRPLTISSSRDKIVQQAMKMVLEEIFEPTFLDTSHGYRPSRGCHSALEQVRLKWTGISWFLEFDIVKCFDSIDRHRLINILKGKIDDQRFIDLIFKLFNAGIVGWKKGLGPGPSEGLSQGSILSPILSNIYLHKLDFEISKITEEYQKGKIRRVFNDVVNAERRIYRKKDFKMLSPERRAAIMSRHRADRRKLGITMTDWNDPNFIRVRYVRYVDDFLLGIAGPKSLVKKIRDRIISFCESNLKLQLTGGDITHIGAGKVKFLGMNISSVPFSKFPRRFGKIVEKKKRIKNRIKLHKSIREVRLVKSVQTALKKAVQKNSKANLSTENITQIVLALKEWVFQNNEFSIESINTYREFILAISKTIIFVPDNLKEDLAALDLKIKEWEENLSLLNENPNKRYKELVGRYDALPVQINAPLDMIRIKLRERGVISKSNKPKAIGRLIHVPDNEIVKWFNAVGRGLLNYYCCCQNFYKIKNYVDYMVRWSAIHTLAGKHKSSSRKIIAKHTKDLIIKDEEGFVLTQFMSSAEIRVMKRQFRTNVSENPMDKVLDQIWAKFTRTKFFGVECAVYGCQHSEIEWHHVSHLKRMKDNLGNISVVTRKGKRVTGVDAFKVAFNRKQIPLCKMHHSELHNNKISYSDINWEYVKEVS